MKIFDKLENRGSKLLDGYFNGESKKYYYRLYTAAFAGIAAFLILLFLVSGKSMIWSNDGVKQHYTALAYYGTYLRSALKNIFVNHTFTLPMWDLHIGFGTDILTTLHYYTIGDPLNFLSVFVPQRYTEYLYGFLILLRMYLAGIVFSKYCFYHKNRQIPVLLGALIYVFSQWILVTGFNHPYFLNPCIYLPLILLGVDMILDGRKPFLYIGALAVAAMSNFYFFYMLGIFTVIYAVFRYFMLFRLQIRQIVYWALRFFVYTLAGILMSGLILLPVVTALLGTDRMNSSHYIPVKYPSSFYHSLLSSFTGRHLSKFTIIGVAAVCMISLFVLFLQRKKYLALKLGVLLLTAMLCIPYAGSALNGFSYATNRWSWAIVMLLSYIFVKMYPEFFRLSRQRQMVLAVLVLLYAGYMLLDPEVHTKNNIAAGILIFVMGLAFLGGFRFFSNRKCLWSVVAAVSIVASVWSNMWFLLGVKEDDSRKIYDYVDLGSGYHKIHGQTELALKSLPGIDSFRFEQNNTPMLNNSAMVNDLNGGQFYFSMAPYGVSDFFEENYLDSSLEQRITGLNNRSWLMKLFSMRYYAGKEGNIPYGYAPVEDTGELPENIGIYEDKNPLPFAYTYDSYINEDKFKNLDAAKRQEAMLQGVVLEESSLPETMPAFSSGEVPFTVSEEEGVKWEDGKIHVRKDGGSCVLNFEGKTLCETYAAFTNFRFAGRINKRTGNKINGPSRTAVLAEIPYDNASNAQQVVLRTKKDNFQSGRKNFMLNMGYHAQPVTKIRLTFDKRGSYLFDKVQVICQEMDTLNQWTDLRKENAPQDLTVNGNYVNCTISLDKKKALVFSIPYNKGWSMYVDGGKREVKKANGMFMAAELEPGSHRIELVYATPYFYMGCLLTLIGIVLTAGIWFGFRRKK